MDKTYTVEELDIIRAICKKWKLVSKVVEDESVGVQASTLLINVTPELKDITGLDIPDFANTLADIAKKLNGDASGAIEENALAIGMANICAFI